MASVFEKRGRWYLRVKNERGVWVKVATSATTKTEAKRLAHDLERRYERQRLGLEVPPPPGGGETVGELLQWWLDNHSKGTASHDWAVRTVKRHLLLSEFAKLPALAVRREQIEALLAEKSHDELGPQSVNHLLGFISRTFSAARRVGRVTFDNPALGVKRRHVPTGLGDYLSEEEVPVVLKALDERWRPLFACAIYAGLRKGELLALLKTDVDLSARSLMVSKSHGRNTTKGGHADAVPIAAELVPYLEAAKAASSSELMFPAEDGSRMKADVGLEHVLRRAMGRAGIATGYTHVCRRQGCSYKVEAPDAGLRRCPNDDRKLWPKPIVRPIRFHSLRHTTATLLLKAGVSLPAVSRIMRHRDPRLTMERYAHLSPEFLHAEIDRLSFGPMPALDARTEVVAQAMNAAPFVPPLSPPFTGAQKSESPGSATVQNRGSISERRKGFEPSTLSLGS